MLILFFFTQMDVVLQDFHEKGFQGNVGIFWKDQKSFYSVGDRVLKQASHDENSSFRIGSLSKSMTALATLEVIEEHGIQLNSPIAKYLPQFLEKYPTLSIEQLLRMQSGFPNHMLRISDREDLNLIEMVHLISMAEPLFEPGEKTMYSNCNYHVLALFLERLEKRPFAEVIETRVLKPLNMTHSFIEIQKSPNSRGYNFENTWEEATPQPMNMTTGSGDVVSTVVDILKYGRALLEKKGPFGKYWHHISQSQDSERGYTMGWRLKPYSRPNGETAYMTRHGGSMRGFLCNMHVYPEENLVIVVLANSRPFPIMDFTEALMHATIDQE